MNFDLWTLLVEQLFGGFWISIFGIGFLIFLIIGVFGRMSKLSVIFYELLFFMTMTIGYGYKWLSVLIGVLIMTWVYVGYKNAYGG
jgi:hypothetical protein